MEPEGFPEVTPGHRSRYGQVINDIYSEIDRGLGKILRSAPREVEVVVVSDHGFQAAYQKIAGKFLRIRTTRLIEALGLTGSLVGTNLDFDVFLQASASSSANAEDILSLVQETLRGAHIAGEDSSLFRTERQHESIRLWIAPRVLVRENARIVIEDKEYDFEDLIRARREAHYSGQHHPDGIYILAGRSAARASDADSLNVLDVAPTVAALLGLPFNPMWQGHPALKGLPYDSLAVAAYPPPGHPDGRPPQMDEDLKRKLRAMGYLD
jgi:arylsulfatase A-like enzyme